VTDAPAVAPVVPPRCRPMQADAGRCRPASPHLLPVPPRSHAEWEGTRERKDRYKVSSPPRCRPTSPYLLPVPPHAIAQPQQQHYSRPRSSRNLMSPPCQPAPCWIVRIDNESIRKTTSFATWEYPAFLVYFLVFLPCLSDSLSAREREGDRPEPCQSSITPQRRRAARW
jgi:hypothetical protein